jgi:hypothetical protein
MWESLSFDTLGTVVSFFAPPTSSSVVALMLGENYLQCVEREHQHTIVRLSKSCKGWRHTCRPMVTHVRLSGDKLKAAEIAAKLTMVVYQYHDILRSVSLQRCWFDPQPDLSSCVLLNELTLRGCWFPELAGGALSNLWVPTLRTCSLSACTNITDSLVLQLLHHCPCIASLKLRGCSDLTCRAIEPMRHLEHLTELDLTGCASVVRSSLSVVAQKPNEDLLSSLLPPSLRSLSIGRTPLTDTQLTHLSRTLPALTRISLWASHGLSAVSRA